MKTISRYIMTLALLLTAVGGAWADETPLLTIESKDYQSFKSGSMTFDDKVTVTFSGEVFNDGDEEGWYAGSASLLTVAGTNGYTITSCKFYTGYGIAVTGYTVEGESPSVYLYAAEVYTDNSKSVSLGSNGVTKIEVYGAAAATDPNAVTAAEINSDLYSGWKSIDEKLIKASELPGFQAVTEDQAKSWTGVPSTGAVILFYEFVADGNVKVVRFEDGVYDSSYEENDLRCYDIYEDIAYNYTKYFYTTGPAPAEPDVEVTTNKAENDTVFTEASFTMPAFDATAEYELVRDMSIQMTATMGDGTDGLRYRVKKAEQGEGYEPAEMNMLQVLALVEVYDGIEQKDLTLNQDYYCRIYKLDEQTLQPEGDGVKLADFDFAPGLYALKAFANVGSNYDGETALSNTFQLFQGYEITVPAGEFVTYYKDEPLRIEDQEADLYTIQSVSADQAVLSSPSDAMPALTPMLIYNKSQQEKVILLIPCAEPDQAITVAPEFQGTLTGTTIAASTDAQTNYAFNGKAFVFVKNDLAIGANKAWLSINTGVPSARITLVFDETTKITNTNITNITNGNWYDLNGRKLDKMPTKKGVYIMNGRKVVVK
ncbi:hypothetical protein [Prevotella sp. E13-27]|uniref:hypothetical protein n=1 Tax=Prevotella sp. E13-27 TaxID=2938122 RepID=UPI00200A69F5|nr:hypothetical protein [Prevotella sp. E13-27]MCK8621580.1 hypothetical protein [Prevotella sp. E13-27]